MAGSDRKGVQEAKEDVINLGKWASSLSPLSTEQPYAVAPRSFVSTRGPAEN